MCVPYSSRSPSINSPPASQTTFPPQTRLGAGVSGTPTLDVPPALPGHAEAERAGLWCDGTAPSRHRSPTTRNFVGQVFGRSPALFSAGLPARLPGCERRLSTATGAPPAGRPAPLTARRARAVRSGRYGPPVTVTDPQRPAAAPAARSPHAALGG